MNKRDPWVLIGLLLVGVTAIVASFGTLMGLAAWVGWHGRGMQFLLPSCLDVLALVSGRVWLSTSMTVEARRFAQTVSMTAIGISIVGNAVGHIVTMHNASLVKVTIAIIAGTIPPAALAAVGHLATLATLKIEVTTPVVEEIVAESIEPAPVIKTVFLGMPSVRESEPVHVVPPRTETRGRPAVKEPVARKYWESERAAGRTPRPQELADVAGADPKMGRKWHAKFTAEDQNSHTTKTGATLTLVTT
jgi:hypothetical protein